MLNSRNRPRLCENALTQNLSIDSRRNRLLIVGAGLTVAFYARNSLRGRR